jgi:predicted nucleic acid-binding protein
MTLVDTSVWIEVFRAQRPLELEAVIAFDDVVTCLPVIQEVLQGFRDEQAFRRARDAMFALPIVEAPLGADVYGEAVALYRLARRTGITVRSSVDCLIAACALRNDLEVLHRDRDFAGLARVANLRTREPQAARVR